MLWFIYYVCSLSIFSQTDYMYSVLRRELTQSCCVWTYWDSAAALSHAEVQLWSGKFFMLELLDIVNCLYTLFRYILTTYGSCRMCLPSTISLPISGRKRTTFKFTQGIVLGGCKWSVESANVTVRQSTMDGSSFERIWVWKKVMCWFWSVQTTNVIILLSLSWRILVPRLI